VLISNAVEATTEELLRWYSLRWQIENVQPDCTSSHRGATSGFFAYHQCYSAARVGELVPTAA
jgi:hypothetical protein